MLRLNNSNNNSELKGRVEKAVKGIEALFTINEAPEESSLANEGMNIEKKSLF